MLFLVSHRVVFIKIIVINAFLVVYLTTYLSTSTYLLPNYLPITYQPTTFYLPTYPTLPYPTQPYLPTYQIKIKFKRVT